MKINRKQLSCFLAATATFLLFPQHAYAARGPMRDGTGFIDCQPNGLGVYTARWTFDTVSEPFFFVNARVKAKSSPARRYFSLFFQGHIMRTNLPFLQTVQTSRSLCEEEWYSQVASILYTLL